ncbi:MAG: molybdate ABC transporter substrate-binding protein [Candidatus Omnitrophica bacterium]|nr:molybdate ABC transporter substrate-binding protein [Candidatus Omnitrophota bacterium]
MIDRNARGSANRFLLILISAIAMLGVLGFVLFNLGKQSMPVTQGAKDENSKQSLFLYCAAGIRPPVEEVAAQYEKEYGTPIQIQYGGSNTLLSQIDVGKTGDLYIAADDNYINLAREKGLVKEAIPLALMRPVLAVKKGNPKNIHAIEDLLRDDVKTALGNPDQAAIGKTTRKLLEDAGYWDRVQGHVTKTGVFKPTVPEVANDVKIGSVDVGVVWDSTLPLYPNLEAVRTPTLDAGTGSVMIGVLTSSQTPTEALRFARYLSSRDKGLEAFKKDGFETVEGDKWEEVPQITFYCGSVNRRAVESLIKEFEKREGVVVNTVYNGCGILTSQMRTIRDQQQGGGFPDTYMACDRYYLESVKDWFQEDVDISDTRVVIAVPKGNSKNIQSLKDLTKPGMRVAVGQPDQCTIGVLTRQTLEAEGVYDDVMKNVVTQTATSAMLVPTVATGSVDAALAYATDTKAESDKVDTIPIDSPAAQAVQPFAIAKSSNHKNLDRRFYRTIARARQQFEDAGFHFRLEDSVIQTLENAKQ